MPYTPPGPPLGSKILTVNPNGGAQYTTIAAALAATVSGDTVLIAPGTYAESFTVPSGVSVAGLNPDPRQQKIITGDSVGTVITMEGGFLANLYVETQSVNPYTIVLVNSGNNYITNCYLYGWNSDTNAAHYALKTAGSASVWIAGSTIVMEDGYNSVGTSSRKLYGVYHGSSGYVDFGTTALAVFEYYADPLIYGTYSTSGGLIVINAASIIVFPVTYANAYAAYVDVGSITRMFNTIFVGQLSGVEQYNEVVHATGTLAAFRSPIWQAALATELVQQIRGAASQSANLQEWQSSAGAIYSTVSENGYYTTRKTTVPADGELATGELAFWFDSTAGAAKLMIKAKNASGVVVTGSVALT